MIIFLRALSGLCNSYHTPKKNIALSAFCWAKTKACTIIALTTLLSCPVYAVNITVTTLDDVINANDGVISLREAIIMASTAPDSDAIDFANNLNGTINLIQSLGPIFLRSNAMIDGNDRITIDSGGITGLNIDDQISGATADVMLRDLVFQNGGISSRENLVVTGSTLQNNSGVVIVDELPVIASLTIDDCMILNGNSAGIRGREVIVESSTFMGHRSSTSTPSPALIASSGSVEASTFDGNDVAIQLASSVPSTFSLLDVNITNNDRGIHVITSVAVTVNDSNFTGNNADDVVGNQPGAAILVTGIDNTLTVNNTDFINNTGGLSSGSGGAISAQQAMISDSTFDNNRAGICGAISGDQITITNTLIENNAATSSTGQGGGACGQLTLINSTVRNNQAPSHAGGLVLGFPSLIRDSVIHNNTAGGNGGGIAYSSLVQGADDSFVINTTVSNNTATLGGGGIWVDRAPTNGQLQIIHTTITENLSIGGNGGGGLFYRIFTPFQPTLVLNSIISGNQYTGPNPAFLGQDITSDAPNGLNLDGNNLIGNTIGLIGFPARPSNLENIDAQLDALLNNGGATLSHALNTGSPAVDAGDDLFSLDEQGNILAFDQRGTGFDRIQSDSVDIGSIESDQSAQVGGLTLMPGLGNGSLPAQTPLSQDVVEMHLELTASPVENIQVSQATFQVSGDGIDNTDITQVRLFLDANQDGLLDAGDQQLGNGNWSGDNGSVTFVGLNRTIQAGQSESWLLVQNLGISACGCEEFLSRVFPEDIIATLSSGAPAPVTGMVTGRGLQVIQGEVSIVQGNNQSGLVLEQIAQPLIVQANNHEPSCGDVRYRVTRQPDADKGMLDNGQATFITSLDASNMASSGYTFGADGGMYQIGVGIQFNGTGNCSLGDTAIFDLTAAGIKLTDSLMSFRPEENQLRTFVQTIEAQNEFTVELAPPGLAGFSLDEVNFALAGQTEMDVTTPFKATFDMQDIMESDQLDITATITLPSGRQQTTTLSGTPSSIMINYPVQAIGIPTWFNAVEFIAEGINSEFDESEREYQVSFEYPTDFVWTETVENIVALLGGAQSELGGPGFRLMLEAGYDIDSNASLSGGIERDITLFNRPVTLFGSVSAGFDQNFDFNTPDDPVGTIGASTSVALGEKSFGRTVLVWGVPVTVALDLGGVLQVNAVGRIYLNENLEFSQLLLSPEPTIQLSAAASISALFGLAKAVATASPTAAGQIHLPYSTANGLEAPRFGGQLSVDFMVEASVFYGLASAEVGSAMLGPYTWGDFIENRIAENFAMMQARQGIEEPGSTYISTHALAGDNNGRALLIFTENVGVSSPNPEILFQYDDGTGLDAPAPLRGTPTPDNRWEMDPAVTFLSGGDAVAVWTSNGGSPSLTQLGDIINEQEIAWSAWNNTSATWTTPTDLTMDSAGDGSADISYDANNGEAVAVWVHDSNPANDPLTRSDWEILSALFNETNGTWSAPIAVSNDSAADYMPAVASRNGTSIAVWSEDADGELFVDPGLPVDDDGIIDGGSNLDASNTDARLVFSTFNGNSWSAKQTLYTSASNTSYTQMADISGYDTERFIAVWIDKQATTDQLYYALYDGGAWAAPVLLAESEQFIEEPTVTVDDFNVATIIYRGYDEQEGDGNGYAGNLFSQTLSLPTSRNTLIGSPAAQALTDDNNVQLFPVSALSGSATRLAWFDKTEARIGMANTLSNTATLALGCNESIVDNDNDGLIDRLDLSVTVTITNAGNYAIAGDLFDTNGQFIARAQSQTVALTPGTRNLTLMFLSADIANSGNDGPYTLNNVSLQVEQPSLLVIDTLIDVCTTSLLIASDFEPSPLRFDQDRYTPGSSGNIILEFVPANSNSTAIDSVSVRVWSNLDTTGIQVTLTETGTNTGLFTGTVIFDPNVSDDVNDRLLAPLGAALVTRYDVPESSSVLTAEALIGISELLFSNGFE